MKDFKKAFKDHIKKQNWGLYRNLKFEMAEKMNVSEAGLLLFLEVCYFDLNGPNNLGGIESERNTAAPFEPDRWGFLAPAVINKIKKLRSQLNLANDQIKTRFFDQNNPVFKNLKLPLAPEECWLTFKNEL